MTMSPAKPKRERIAVGPAKGRPMLSWVGKRPLRQVTAFPAQEAERFAIKGGGLAGSVDWTDWPARYPRSGLLFHGDNKEVLAHLLANGFRGTVDLVYIDPPFDSGADYVRRVALRGPAGTVRLDGQGYTLGEQIQYTDIWANDNYLQFMYERLMLIRELMSDGSAIFLHCDSTRGHQIRMLMDEVFGPSAFLNEIVWSYRRWPGNVDSYQAMHDTVFYYVAEISRKHVFHKTYEEASPSYMRRFGGKTQRLDETSKTRKITVDEPTRGMPTRDVWDLSIVAGSKAEREGYPTQKPESLLERIIANSSNPGALVLDCFMGSGTTAAVAQKLGRRWIGCDINKGAIQTTAKRLMEIMDAQAGDTRGTLDLDDTGKPAQLSFTTYRVNDYDLAIQHNEAVNLACEHLGVVRTRTDGFFDGTLGPRLVKIVPFDHPITPVDLDEVARELRNRPGEDRDVTVVGLGRELACDPWLADHNRKGAPNQIAPVDLRTDPRYGKFFAHQPAAATVTMSRTGERVRIVIEDFVSPSIVERLASQDGLIAPRITDWRSMVDSVLVDTSYDGAVFDVALADVPERKDDLVDGQYDLTLPPGATTVAVKITDMLGEELLVTAEV
ncbi:MAG TPA: site-specific DNA-methyltransferase [Candidatus Limnocylindria bacterium]|nr:site-specific DNA-methyltransferase [Candidatus Limnocylindria bacterium]